MLTKQKNPIKDGYEYIYTTRKYICTDSEKTLDSVINDAVETYLLSEQESEWTGKDDCPCPSCQQDRKNRFGSTDPITGKYQEVGALIDLELKIKLVEGTGY